MNSKSLNINPNKKYMDKENNLVSTIYLFDNHDNVLLQLRDNNPNIVAPNEWGPLGGHCNYGETPYECAIREFHEESGYKCNNIHWFGNYFFPYRDGLHHIVCTFWSVYDNKQKINCYEGQKIIFLSLREVSEINISKKNLDILLSINKIKQVN